MTVPLPIVVFGDSIQWGQGLRPGAGGAPSDKMAELVGAGLAASPAVVKGWAGGSGIAVSVSRFASSGATISGGLGTPSPLTPVTSTTPFPAGEVPGSTPTVLDQVAGAPKVIDASAVRLVIVDGGINDVGLFTSILNPLVSPATVAAAANAACGGTLTGAGAALLPPGTTVGLMSTALAAIGSAFPSAVVVVTGYYDILSAFSDLTGLIIAVGFLSGSVSPELLLPGGWLISAIAGQTASGAAAAGVIANCATFTAASNTALTSAVALANAAPGGTFTAEGFTVPRFSFVACPFTPVNALFTGGSNGADETAPTTPAFLWGFNPGLDVIGAIIDQSVAIGAAIGGILGSVFGGIFGTGIGSNVGAIAGAGTAVAAILPLLTPVDEVVAARNGPGGPCGGGGLVCTLASVGHPNIEGEAAYAGAIIPPMITMFGTSLPTVGLAGVISVISKCMIATAAMEPTQEDQVTRIQQLRDELIARSPLGREFFAAAASEYYAFSPIIVARMRNSPEFRERVRRFIVSPLLSFADVLLDRSPLADAIDASLADLAQDGISGAEVGAAAAEIARLHVHGAVTSAPQTALGDMVNYFNAVTAEHLLENHGYVDALLLDPLKLYWELLASHETRAIDRG
jgi:hypothetical protein